MNLPMARARPEIKGALPRQPPPRAGKNELAAALAAEIGRCVARANDHATRLQNIGDQALDVTGEIFRDASAKDLMQSSSQIRGIVNHALGVLAELQCEGGRLGALAALREAQSIDELEPTP